MASRNKFLCLDCKVDTGKIGEFYYLKDEVWLKIVDSKTGMICISCAEKRLGRKLTIQDFTNCYLNNHKTGSKSQRLVDRILT